MYRRNEHTDAIRKGVAYWNKYREENQLKEIDISNQVLTDIKLNRYNSGNVAANLTRVNFSGCDLSRSDLYGAVLDNSILFNTNLKGVSLTRAICKNCDFTHACLEKTSFHKAIIDGSNFTNSYLHDADFTFISGKGIKLKGARIVGMKMESVESFPGPWSVNPYGLIDAEDLHLVDVKSQPVILEYFKKTYKYLHQIPKEEIIDFSKFNDVVNRIREFFSIGPLLTPPPNYSGIIQKLNLKLIEEVKNNPKALYEMHWRSFEELIAEMLASFGWKVELSAATKDGGYDIFAIYRDESGIKHPWIIECKKYSPEYKVGIETVRSLYGVKTDMRVGNAMLATTSFVTEGVEKFKSSHYDFATKDFNGIMDWVNAYVPNKNGSLYIHENRLGYLPNSNDSGL